MMFLTQHVAPRNFSGVVHERPTDQCFVTHLLRNKSSFLVRGKMVLHETTISNDNIDVCNITCANNFY